MQISSVLHPAFQAEIRALVRDEQLAALKEFFSENNANAEGEHVRSPATKQQACDYLQISVPTFDALFRAGQLPAFYIGRQVRIKWEDLEAYVNKKGAEALL